MGEYADEAVDRLLGEHGYMMRQRRRQRRRQHGIEDRRAMREAEHKQMIKDVIDDLPDLNDDE